LGGDVDGAIAFGLANGPDELAHLTSMLASAIPDGIEFIATWAVRGTSCALAIDHPNWKLQQTFHRVESGLEVEFGMLVIDETSRRRGFTKRLIRNLAVAYGALGIRYVRTYANHVDGAIAWAKLGARPQAPEQQRDALLARLAAEHQALGIGAEYLETLTGVIDSSSDKLLFRNVAAVVGENGEPLGERLLRHHGWQAYWDLHDPELRSHLKDVVG
jgi:hypothetical protein